MTDQLRLTSFLVPGQHVGAWRAAGVPDQPGTDLAYHVAIAQVAERGLLDAVFVGDTGTIPEVDADELSRMPDASRFDPTMLMASLAAVTKHIGLVATVETTYNEPYHVARRFASLDHLSGGRAGWNLVTSALESHSLNFGRSFHPPIAERYERAEEFHDVVRGLWDSWDDDAFVGDRENGRYSHVGSTHFLNHEGKHFSVRGPINIARPPQGHPVVVQAGSSEAGRALGARTADVIFTAQPTIEVAKAFYADMKQRAVAYGRSADDLKVLPGLSVVVGATEEDALRKRAEQQDLIHPAVGVAMLSRFCGFDLRDYPLDGPLPDLSDVPIRTSRRNAVLEVARRGNLTIRQLYREVTGSFSHFTLTGTVEQIADSMELWLREGAADGFNLFSPLMLESLTEFVDQVVPELQRRGIFRTAYSGTTLRENLGLPRPASRHIPASAALAE